MARIIDYHIHTSFSDGFFSPKEMIQAAIERGVHEFCITDHFSTWKPALTEGDLEEYFTTLEEIRCQESLRKNAYIGIEVDTSSIKSFDILEEFQWDLILFEYVFSQVHWENKFRQVLNFKKNNPDYQVGLAHTRFTRVSESKFSYVIERIREFDIIIELNTGYGNYMDRWFNYLDEEFWYSIGSDAHHTLQLGNCDPAIKFLTSRNISLNRIISL